MFPSLVLLGLFPLLNSLPTFAIDQAVADTPAAAGITLGFPYGSKTVRGVNLGGWLLLEVNATRPLPCWWILTCSQPWITPSLFDNTGNKAIIDEWTFGQKQDYNTALAALTQHWDTWITEQDFKDIAAAGLVSSPSHPNHVLTAGHTG